MKKNIHAPACMSLGTAHRHPLTLFAGVLMLMFFVTPLNPARAMSVPEFKKAREEGESIRVVDVRNNFQFQNGHVPGALNIPASLIAQKRLPRLGRVVVCGTGLGQDTQQVKEAVTALNEKPGIQAEILEGGFAAWETSETSTTRPVGVQPEDLPMITYQQLHQNQSQDMVLIDLRPEQPQERQNQTDNGEPLLPNSDLKEEFPNVAAVSKSPFQLPQVRQSDASAESPLLVLVDDGKSNSARELARKLRANGNRRVVILAGGEEIIRRDGKPGLKRLGLGAAFETSNNSNR